MFLFWVQAVDQKKTAESTRIEEFKTFYEGFVCAIRYDEGENKKFFA